MYHFLLLDLDDTILDFHKAEAIALSTTLRQLGIAPTPEAISLYSAINKGQWEKLERGEISRKAVLTSRFELFFAALGLAGDGEATQAIYEKELSKGHYFIPGAQALLNYLYPRYRLFLVSNGNSKIQYPRIESAGITEYFEKIFISEEMGVTKPSRAFFDRCFAAIPGFQRERAMIIGDSLTSDIQGGKNAGISTCWLNTTGKTAPADCQPDVTVGSLFELVGMV